MSDVKQFFEKAIEKAEIVQLEAKKYELSRSALEELEKDNIRIYVQIEDEDIFEKKYTYTPISEEIELQIIDFLKSICRKSIEDSEKSARKILGEDIQTKPEQKESAPAAEQVSNEEIMKLLEKGLTHKQIADMTGMKANTVSHRVAYIKEKNGTEVKKTKPKTYTKNVISDEQLEEMYFKQGLTVKQIAEKYGVNPAGLYKRTEALKDKRFQIAKECACSK